MSTAICARVANALSGRPICMEPRALKAMLDAIGPRLGLVTEASVQAEEGEFAARKRAAQTRRLATILEAEPVEVADGMAQYAITADGIAVLPIVGTLINRYDWLAAWCGFVSYDTIMLAIEAMELDGRVRAILLDIDSPGGEAAGMLDCADLIANLASKKPTWAVANTLAASAGYGLACAAEKLYLPRLASVGSIGVVCVHTDQSAADKMMGLKFTALYSGARKIDGWGHAPLSEEARAAIQGPLDAARLKFAETVAEYRGLKVADVLATEAGLYDDDAAVEVGLADGVASFDQTLALLRTELGAGL